MSILNFFFDFIFPKFCIYCDKKGGYVCEVCVQVEFVYYKHQVCHVCKKQIVQGLVHDNCADKTNLVGVIVVLHYDDFAKRLLKEIKYDHYFAMADDIGKMLETKMSKQSLKIDIVSPVPLHRKKLWKRGFNQAKLIAKKAKLNPVDLLKRKKNTRTQVGLNRAERIKNLGGAFEVYKSKIDIVKNSNILLVDDVMTSGTTLEECAGALKLAGAKMVYGLVWARD